MKYELLQRLIEAMVDENEVVVEELKKELKDYLTNADEFDGREFAYDLIDAMNKWSEELRKARRFKNALRDFLEDEFTQIYEYVDSRCDYVNDRVDKVRKLCRY
jgi:hypothetical protein